MKETREIIRNPLSEADIDRPYEPHVLPVGRYATYRDVQSSEGFQLLDYWRAIRKRLWLVIGIAVLITTLTAIYMARKPDIFSAHAVVQVDNEQINPELVTNDRQRPISTSDPSYFNTQLQLLSSDGLLRRAIKEHSLDSTKEFQAAKNEIGVSPWRAILRSLGLATDEDKKDKSATFVPPNQDSATVSSEEVAEAVRLAPYVNIIKANIEIDPVREPRTTFKDTRLIGISFRHKSPEFAAFVVNSIADTFSVVNQEKRSGTSQKTNTYLQERITSLETDIHSD